MRLLYAALLLLFGCASPLPSMSSWPGENLYGTDARARNAVAARFESAKSVRPGSESDEVNVRGAVLDQFPRHMREYGFQWTSAVIEEIRWESTDVALVTVGAGERQPYRGNSNRHFVVVIRLGDSAWHVHRNYSHVLSSVVQ